MKRLSILTSLIIIIVSVLTACTSSPAATVEPQKETVEEATTAPEVKVADTATPEPAEPKVLRFALSADPMTMEPGILLNIYISQIAKNLHASLFTYGEDGSVLPYIAESWEANEDGTVYTFHLRDDVVFHNGRKLTANDFKAGWTRYLTPSVQSNVGPDYLGSIVGAAEIIDGKSQDLTGVEVVDDTTFKVTLTKKDPSFILRLASPHTAIVPAEAVVEGKPEWVADPVGAGPFKFVEWSPNERVVLEAFDGFFLGKPQIDRIEYYIVPDAATQVAMYEAGELDIVEVPAGDINRIETDENLSKEMKSWSGLRLGALMINPVAVPELGDVKVRQAIGHAIDRVQLAKEVLQSVRDPAEGIVPPGVPSYDPTLKGPEYDPEAARQFLAEAGYPGGEGFPPIEIMAYSTNDVLAEAIAIQLSTNLGIDASVLMMEEGAAHEAIEAKDELGVFLSGWRADFPSAETWLHQWLRCDVETNFVNYCNPEYDALVDQAMQTVDLDEQNELWREAERMAMDDLPFVPLNYSRFIYLIKPYVKNFTCNFSGPIESTNMLIEK